MDETVDAELGTVCLLLTGQGDGDLAKQLARAVTDVTTRVLEDDFGNPSAVMFLEVEPHYVSAFDEDELRRVANAYSQVRLVDGHQVAMVNAVPRLVEGDWRPQVLGRHPNASNQASLVYKEAPFVEDRMRFRSSAELNLYRALRSRQLELPPGDTITILPNATARVPGHSWEPDLVIAYHGRVGAIEVDGSHHANRHAADRSRDRIFEDGGFAYVDHITAEEADGPEAQFFVERFLRRLRQAK